MPPFEVIPGSPHLQLVRDIEDLVPSTGYEPVFITNTGVEISFFVTTPEGVGVGKAEHEKVIEYLMEDLKGLNTDNTKVIQAQNGACSIFIDCNSVFNENQPVNLAEYRKEKMEPIENLKKDVLSKTNEYLHNRIADYFTALSINERTDSFEIIVMKESLDTSDQIIPSHVIRETGLVIADYLKESGDNTFTVDGAALNEEPPSIRIIKM